MKNRKKRNLIIISLACLLVFMGVGYAVLSTTLSIKGAASLTGKWDIHIESIEATTTNGTATSETPTLSENKLGASFDATLKKPGDYVEYTIVVKNAGSIPAMLTELKPTITGEDIDDIILTHTMIHGQILKENASTTFTLRVLFDDRATDVVTNAKATIDIELLYTQWDGNEENLDLTTQPVTANDCFMIDSNGVIFGYNNLCGTYVTIPDRVDGIDVKKISEYAFKNPDVSTFDNENTGKSFILVHNLNKYSAVQTFVANLIASGEVSADGIEIIKYEEKDNYLTGATYASGMMVEDDGASATDVEHSTPANIVYLDLSQATHLTFIDSNAFVSPTTPGDKTLRYLNLYGVNLSDAGKMDDMFNNAVLTELTIDSDFFNKSASDMGTVTVNKLRVLKGTSTVLNNINNKLHPDQLIIGEGITEVGGFGAINGHISNNIKSVILPSSIEKIADYAFANSGLETLTTKGYKPASGPNIAVAISPTVKYVGNYAFANNNITGTVSVSSDVIGNYAFTGNSGVNRVDFLGNGNLTSIGNYAFDGCSIKLLNAGESDLSSLKTIGDYAFRNLTSASSANFGPQGLLHRTKVLETIGTGAFYGHSSTVSVLNIPASVKSIGNNAFVSKTGKLTIYTSNSSLTYNGHSPQSSTETEVVYDSSTETADSNIRGSYTYYYKP